MSLFDFSKTDTPSSPSKSSGLFDFSSISSGTPTSTPTKSPTSSIRQTVENISSNLFSKLKSVVSKPLNAVETGLENVLGKADTSNVPGAQYDAKPKAMDFPILTGPSKDDIDKKIADLQIAKKNVVPTDKKSIDAYNAKVSEIQSDIGSFNNAQGAQNVLGKETIPTPYDSPMKLLSRDLSHVLNAPIEATGEALGGTKVFQNLAQGSDAGKFIPSFVESLANHLQYAQGAIEGATGGIVQPNYTGAPDDFASKLIHTLSQGVGMAGSLGALEETAFGSLNAPKAIQETFQNYPKIQTLFNSLAKAVPAFATYGQLNPDLNGIGDRLKTLGKDIATAIPFTALGLIDSKNLVVPVSAALGYGMAKLSGASNEDAAVSATALGLLSLMGGKGETSKEIITQRQAKGQLYDEAINTINKYADTKLGSDPTPKEIKDAFKEAALKTHPDRGGDAKDFSAVSYAKDVLLGETKSTESVMERQRAQDSKDEIKKTAQEVQTPPQQEKNPFKEDIQNIAVNFKQAEPKIEGLNPKQKTKLTLEEAQPLAESASKQYYDKFITPAIKAGKATVIGADDLKDYFGKDYNDNNHPVYSRAAHLVFERALKENPSPDVIFTGGGPASGKTELVTKALLDDGYKGIVYDSNMANYEGVSKQIQMARDTGKNVKIYGVIPNLEDARTFSIQRENNIGRGISDTTFARGHAGFPSVMLKLLDEGIIKPSEVKILDTRESTTFEEAFEKAASGDYIKNPLALLKELGYNEQELKKTYAKENYNKETGKPINPNRQGVHKLQIRSGSSETSPQDRSDQGNANRGADESLLGETKQETERQIDGRKPLLKVPVSLKRVIDYKERLKLRGVDPVLVDAIITPSGNTAYGVSVGNTIAFENVVEQFTEDHEIFHQIFQNFDKMRLFKNFDKEALLTEAKDLYGDIPVDKLEEEMAKDFQQYVNDRESGKESTFFGKIKEFFERLYASFKRLFRNQNDIKEFYRTIAEGKAKEETNIEQDQKLQKFVDQAKTAGQLDFRQEQYALAQFLQKTPMTEVFNDEGDLTLKTLTKLKGRTTVSKQFIEDLSNSGDIKQVERDLIRSMLETEPDIVNVKKFSERVKDELLPLKLVSMNEGNIPTNYENVTLNNDQRGNVANYDEHVYNSPIKTSAGDVHFTMYDPSVQGGYFGHTRIEDMAKSDEDLAKINSNKNKISPKDYSNLRRVIEVQSDLYQKGNLQKDIKDQEDYIKANNDILNDPKRTEEEDDLNFIRNKNIERQQILDGLKGKLSQYNDPTAHFRMVREEVRKAAQDGKTKLQFPTGETAMKIEGLGSTESWYEFDSESNDTTPPINKNDLHVGQEITQNSYANSDSDAWIITDVLGDGKFKAVEKRYVTDPRDIDILKDGRTPIGNLENLQETFDISGKVDTNNPIYRFYEKDLSRYLKNNYGAKPVTDDKGVTWMEVNVDPTYADLPVPAFNKKPEDIEQLRNMLKREQESLDIANANPEMHAQAYGPDRIEKYKKKIADLKSRIAETKNPTYDTNDKLQDARSALAFAEHRMGVKNSLETKVEGLNDIIDAMQENIDNHPGKKLQKFMSKKEGVFEDFRNPDLAKTPSEKSAIEIRNKKIMHTAENALAGTSFADEFDNPDIIREQIDEYKNLQEHIVELKQKRTEIRKKVRNIKTIEKIQTKDSKILKEVLDKQATLTEKDISNIVNSKARKTTPRSLLQQSILKSQQSRQDYLSTLLEATYEFLPEIDAEKPSSIDLLLQSRPITLEENDQLNKNDSLQKILIDTNTPVKYKVGILDYLRTPDRVLKKIGLGNINKPLRFAYESYLAELPAHMDLIKHWANRVPEKGASKRIFRYLDGQSNKDYFSGKIIKDQLSPKELEVAQEIKTYLKDWAERLGLPEDKQLSHYITHIFDIGANEKEFDEDVAKIIDKKIPGQVYDPFLQERLGKKGYIEDVFKALEAYSKRAVRKVNMDPILDKIKTDSKRLELSQQNYVKRLVDKINFRPTEIENLLDNTIKQVVGYRLGQRPTVMVTSALRKLVFRAFLGLNVKSAIKNLTQGVNTYAKLGEKYTLVGYTKLITQGTQELEDVGVLGQDMVQDRTVSATKKFMQKFDDTLFYLFETAEKINRGAAYYGAKSKAIAEGKTEFEAVEEGKKLVRDTQFNFGSIDTPVFLNDSITKTLGQFLSFGFKESEFIAEMAKNKEWKGILRYIAASLFMIFFLGKSLGINWKDFVPFYSIFSRFGQVPPALALPGSIIGAALNTPDAFGHTRTLGQKAKDIASNIPYPAKSQIEKTVGGAVAIKNKETETKADAVEALFFGATKSNTPLVQASKDLKTKQKTTQTKVDGYDKALVDQMETLYTKNKNLGFDTDEAQASVDNLSDTEYNIYKAVAANEKAKDNLALESKVLPIVQKANALGFDTQEADDYVTQAFPDTPQGDAEFATYTSLKNSLYGQDNQKNTTLGTWDKQSFITHIANIAKAVGTDPVSAFNDIFAGNGSWRIIGQKNGQIMVQRMSEVDSETIKKAQGGDTKELKLDHAVSLEAGGNNGNDNLQIIPTGDENTPGTWAWNTATENIIGKALGEKKINGKQAREYMIRFKATAGEQLSKALQKEFKEKYNSEPLTPEQISDIINSK